jgi:hypothetical protein
VRTPTPSETPDALLERILEESRAALEAQLGAQLLAAYAVRWYWDGFKLVSEPVSAEEIFDGP